MIQIVTKSAKETKKVAALLADELQRGSANLPLVVALEGNLGSGKTTFTQGFAHALGVRENVLSPTFVLLKIYPLKKKKFKHLLHIDCYRLASPKELLHLGIRDFFKDKDAIILIEWADRVRRIIPRHAIWISFRHISPHTRRISILPPALSKRNAGHAVHPSFL